MKATIAAVLALAVVVVGFYAAYEIGLGKGYGPTWHVTVQELPTSASADTRASTTTASDASATTTRRPTAATATASEPTATRHPKMRQALLSHFIPHEADQLVALYDEVNDREPQNWSEVRARARDILGNQGFHHLMEVSAIPKDLTTDLARMEYMFGNPLVWWSALQE